MCAPNKTKKGKKAFSYLFRTHLVICHGVRPLEHHVKNWRFSSSACQCIALLRCSTILTKC